MTARHLSSNMNRIYAVLTLATLWVSLSTTLAADPPVVALVGDSNTARGARPIARTLLAAGWKAANFGVAGATIIDGTNHPYFREENYQAALQSEADFVIIMLGTNDAAPKWWPTERETDFDGTAAEEFKARYLELIESFQAMESQPRILLALPLPVFPESARSGASKEREGRKANLDTHVIPLIREIAAEKDLPMIDVNGHMAESPELSTDGVHYSEEGYLKMSDAFVAALRQ